MNQLKFDSDLIYFNQLNHLTQLDVSHNHRLIEFDLRALSALEKFNCSYNNMTRLILNGHSLRYLNASHNSKNRTKQKLSTFVVSFCFRIEKSRICFSSVEFDSFRHQFVSFRSKLNFSFLIFFVVFVKK